MSEHTPTIEKIDHLLSRAEHDSGYQAFVYMRKIWPHLKMAAESHEALVKALTELLDACESIGTFSNGVIHNGIDEGNVYVAGLIDQARDALTCVGQPGKSND